MIKLFSGYFSTTLDESDVVFIFLIFVFCPHPAPDLLLQLPFKCRLLQIHFAIQLAQRTLRLDRSTFGRTQLLLQGPALVEILCEWLR